MSEAGPSIARVTWDRALRIVPTRLPPVGPFDTVADPGELQQLYEVEAWTNERLAEELGQLELVDPADRIAGPGTPPRSWLRSRTRGPRGSPMARLRLTTAPRMS